jgi:hypothetical protein
VQKIHAEDDLFERTWRHGADKDAVEVSQPFRSVSHTGGQATEIDGDGIVPEPDRGTPEIADVPAIAGREEGYAHAEVVSRRDGGELSERRKYCRASRVEIPRG